MTDVTVHNVHSIALLTPRSGKALAWVDKYINQDIERQPYWPAIVCEPRYVDDVVNGMAADGLVVRWE